jgi:tetratricopeptide (TPR) repeat protein
MAAGDYEGAIKWFTQAIDFDPNNQVYYSNRSAASLSKGFAEIALKDVEKCISLNPEWPKGYGRKGATLHKMEAYDKAIKAYEDGLKAAPGDEALLNGLEQVKADMNETASGSGGGGSASSRFHEKEVPPPPPKKEESEEEKAAKELREKADAHKLHRPFI